MYHDGNVMSPLVSRIVGLTLALIKLFGQHTSDFETDGWTRTGLDATPLILFALMTNATATAFVAYKAW